MRHTRNFHKRKHSKRITKHSKRITKHSKRITKYSKRKNLGKSKKMRKTMKGGSGLVPLPFQELGDTIRDSGVNMMNTLLGNDRQLQF